MMKNAELTEISFIQHSQPTSSQIKAEKIFSVCEIQVLKMKNSKLGSPLDEWHV